MKKEFNKLWIKFCEEYEMLMLVWEDDFFENFNVKIKCAQSYIWLMNTEEALEKEIRFTSSN